MDAEPDNAFTVEELCRRVYPIDQYERGALQAKHRVSVIRAGKNVCKRRPEIGSRRAETLGKTLVFYRKDNVRSYAMFRLKIEFTNHYQPNDRRLYWTRNEDDLRKMLEDDYYQKTIAPGGDWWNVVQRFIAERDGDTEKFAQLKAEEEVRLAAALAEFKGTI